MNLADRIQHLRKTNGMSQEDLANQVDVSRQAVSKWESGQSTPDLDKIILMSDLFQVTTDYILKGIEPEPASPAQKNHAPFLYLGFAMIFAILAGIWSFASNRFSPRECFFLVLAGAAFGIGIGLVFHVFSSRKETGK